MRSLAGRQTRVARRLATTAAAGHARRHASAVAPVAPVAPVPRSFEKILIANRGEIACRVIRTARALGIRTVAVYSDADAGSMHVQMADEAYHIGGNAATDSYLKGDTILEVAQASGAQVMQPTAAPCSPLLTPVGPASAHSSVWPGRPPRLWLLVRERGLRLRGPVTPNTPQCHFNEDLITTSDMCVYWFSDAGIVFIGPPVDAIVAMGSKSESKNIMEAS